MLCCLEGTRRGKGHQSGGSYDYVGQDDGPQVLTELVVPSQYSVEDLILRRGERRETSRSGPPR